MPATTQHTFTSAVTDDPNHPEWVRPSNWNGTPAHITTLNVDLASEVTGILPEAHGGTGATSAAFIKKDGTTTTTAAIPFAQGISVVQPDGGDSTCIDITCPLGDTVFGIRFQGYYTDCIRFDGEAKTNNSSISNFFAFEDNTLFRPSTAGKSYWSFATAPIIAGSSNITNVYGHLASPFTRPSGLTYSGTATTVSAFEAQGLWSTGAATDYSLFHGTFLGGAGIVNAYGLLLGDVTLGTSSNYAIKTGLGSVQLGALTSNGFVKTSGGTGLLSVDTASYTPTTRTLTATSPITGGGDLSANRSFGFDFSTNNSWTGTNSYSQVITSTVATGTAPLTIASTTQVSNLNVSQLQGKATGTSGNTIPLLDGTNTWSNNQQLATTKQLQLGASTRTITDDGTKLILNTTNKGGSIELQKNGVAGVGLDSAGNGVFFKGGTKQVGSSGVFATLGAYLASYTTDRGNTGSGETDLGTYTLAANSLVQAGDMFEFEQAGTFASNINNKRIRVYCGTTVIFDTTALAFNGGTWWFKANILYSGVGTQRCFVTFLSTNSLLGDSVAYTASSESMTSSLVFKSTGQATSDNDIVMNTGPFRIWTF